MREARSEPREPKAAQYTLTWKSRDGKSYSAEAYGFDISPSGVGLECPCELKTGAIVNVEAHDGSLHEDCEVVHCTREGQKFHVGFEFREERRTEEPTSPEPVLFDEEPDHYDTLQISRKADAQTIHRVFRMMAARFHPDNPETGDVEQFLRMKRAYAVLSEPDRRAEYDTKLEKNRDAGPRPIFALKDFVTGVEAESNRRLGVLSLLYNRRQTSPDRPDISLLDLEREMGFPREYLSFTMWYLRAKDLVTVADNSDYTLTAAGADYVEKKAVRNEIVGQLLNRGASRARPSHKAARGRQKSRTQSNGRFLLPPTRSLPGLD